MAAEPGSETAQQRQHDGAATSVASAQTPTATDVLEERMIDEEYKIWKKNTPFLYDYVMTHSLEWPSLTVQWLPSKPKAVSEFSMQHELLIGTHTNGEPNYLMVATCCLPKDSSNNAASTKRPAPTFPPPEYDEEKGDFGGYGLTPQLAGGGNNNQGTVGKISVMMKIPHQGEVNRARIMPQNPFIVASRGPQPEVYIWDRTKHPSRPEPNATPNPNGVCRGHTREGYGMAWSFMDQGHLATVSEDCTVKLWDVSHVATAPSTASSNRGGGSSNSSSMIEPYLTLEKHTDIVEDVDWHNKDPNLLVSVGGDQAICIWSKNQKDPQLVVPNAHKSDINSVSFNPHNETIFATGSSDKTIGIWDVRRLSSPVHSLEGVHVDDVFCLAWAPHDEAILASCSADRRVAVYDLSRIGQEQSPEDAEDGPPELLFLHGGHTSKVSDLAWNMNSPWTLASTSEDNIIQLWRMAEEIHSGVGETGKGTADEDGLGPMELE